MAKSNKPKTTEAPKFNEDVLKPFGHKKGKSVVNFLKQFGYDESVSPADFCKAHWCIEI